MKEEITEIVQLLENEHVDHLNFKYLERDNHPYSNVILGNVEHDIHMRFSVKALLYFLKHELKKEEVHVENLSTEEKLWSVVDIGNTAIHLVNPFVRELYALDRIGDEY
jgi:hypothetical protein